MYRILVTVIFIAGMSELGISMTEVAICFSGRDSQCAQKLSKEILKVKWRPISIFLE